MTRESEILRAVHRAIGARPDARLWRVNVGAAVPVSRACAACRRYTIRFGVPGMADLMGVLAPGGRMLSIECKSPSGKLTDEQRAWDAMVRRFGGLSIAPCRSVEEALEAIGS